MRSSVIKERVRLQTTPISTRQFQKGVLLPFLAICTHGILVYLKIPVQPLAGVCWVYFITRKKGIGKMLYRLFSLIIVFVLSFATDARYMSPNFRPVPQRWLSSAPYFPLLPALTFFCFYAFLSQPDVFGKGFQLQCMPNMRRQKN